MASNGLLNRAKTGTCRICQRARNSNKYLKVVGEVRHGFATGYIWECIDEVDCNKVALQKISSNHLKKHVIENALQKGRFKEYTYIK